MFESSGLPVISGSTRIVSLILVISRISCAIVILIGCLGLLGWAFDIAMFKQVAAGLAAMKPNTALSFVLAGTALVCLQAGPGRQPIRWLGRICASMVAAIALLTLGEYYFGWDVGIDQLLFADLASALFPGRMSVVTALSFMLLGLALLLFDARRAYWLASALIFMALLIAWVAIIGYIYGVASLYQSFPFSTIGVHTAAALLILGIGALCARPSYGLAALIASDSAAGLMARRLLPVAVFMPVLLGWLRWIGELGGLYDAEFGLMLMVVATTLIFAAFIWWNAKSLNHLELDRLRIAQALHISEERFRAIFEQAAVGIARVGLQGQWLQVNRKLCDIVGYTPAELMERTFQDITYYEDLDTDLEHVRQVLRAAISTYSIEKRYIRKDGSLVWVNLTVSLVREVTGEPQYFIAVIQNIADRKQAEAALRESEEWLGGIVGSAMDAIVSLDEARNILLFNAAAEQMFRCSAATVLGQSIDQFIPAHLRERHTAHMRTFGATGVTSRSMRSLGTLAAVRADGEEFPIEATISQIVVAGKKFYTVIMRDITDRKRVETALQTERYRLRMLIDSLPDLIFLKDTRSRFMIGNRALAQFMNVGTPEALLGKTDFDFFPHGEAARYYDQEQQVIRSGEPLVIPEKYQTDVTGNYHWLSTTKMALRDAQGQVVGLVGIEREITERKWAESALRQSEERFATAFRASPAAMVIARLADGSIIDTNESYQRLLGYSREELIGHSGIELNIFIDPEERAELVRLLREWGCVHDYETVVRAKSGQLHTVLASIEAIELDGEICNLVILFDITDRKRAERAIQRYTERLKHLRQIDHAMLASRSLDDIAKAVLANIWQMIACARASVALVDMADQTIRLLAVQLNGELRAPPSLQAPIEIIGAAIESLKQGQVYQVPDIAALPEPPALRALQLEHAHAYAYVPIMSDTRLSGILCLGLGVPGAFPGESIDIAIELAGQLAIAIDQAQLRAEIEQHASELEQRVAARTSELAAANKDLEAFSYSVSHDLRAPLRAIAGFSRILIEEYVSELPDEAREYLLLVRENAQHMDNLINDLLAFARLGRQALNKQRVAPAEMVREIIAEIGAEQTDRQIEIVIAELPSCWADPALLRQVYVNLLTNALKFTGKRALARIEVGARPMPDQPGEMAYFVADNGAGFDMRYASKLFGVFQRLHRAEDYEGTGVGLAIVQRVIHRHSGRVWAEAAVDQGATFYFTIGGSGSDD